jgi:hypothetical protein
MARKSILATLVGVTALAVPSAFADEGGVPHEGSNGQGRPADQTQTQAQTKTSGKALAKGHAKTHAKGQAKAKGHAKVHVQAQAKGHAKVHVQAQAKAHTNGKALAKGHANTQAPTANVHAKAGKTTICHATGSATNPYVTITISNNALPAHRRHQDGRDIIPAPAGGCPTAAGQAQQPAGSEQQGSTQGTTGSSTQSAAGTQSQGTAGANAQGTAGAGTGSTPGESTNGSGKSPNQVSVLGASTSGSAPSASNSPSATGTQASSSNGLPFTGTDAIIVAILGLAALLLGVSVRRATTNRV